MQKLDSHTELPIDQKDLINEGRQITEEVLQRIGATSK